MLILPLRSYSIWPCVVSAGMLLAGCVRHGFEPFVDDPDEELVLATTRLDQLNALSALQSNSSDCLRQLTVDPFGIPLTCEAAAPRCTFADASATPCPPGTTTTGFPQQQWGTSAEHCGIFRYDDFDGDGTNDIVYERNVDGEYWCDYQFYPPDQSLLFTWGALQQVHAYVLFVVHPIHFAAHCGFALGFGEVGDGDPSTADGPAAAPLMNISLAINGRDWASSLGRFNQGLGHISEDPHPNDQLRIRYGATNRGAESDYADITVMSTWFNQDQQPWQHVTWGEEVGTIQPPWNHPQAVGNAGEWVLLRMSVVFDHTERTVAMTLTPLDRGSDEDFSTVVQTPTANVSAWSPKTFTWRYAEHDDSATGDDNWAFDLQRAGPSGEDLTWEELDALPVAFGFNAMGAPRHCVWFQTEIISTRASTN